MSIGKGQPFLARGTVDQTFPRGGVDAQFGGGASFVVGGGV